MPRKAKEKEKIEEVKDTTKKTAKKTNKTSSKKVSSKDSSKKTTKKETAKKEKKSSKKVKETESTKKLSPLQKVLEKTKKSSQSRSRKKSDALNTVLSQISSEYYDLPFRYNETVIKILAQTPTVLFIYWDISDKDRKALLEKYGPEFFNNSLPYLIITNKTMDYSFETQINDFANSWYLHINDANCEYKIELVRKFITNSDNNQSFSSDNTNIPSTTPYYKDDMVLITESNEIESPNDHILFDKLGKFVFFKNIKTNIIQEKDITSLYFISNIGKVYNIYDLYKTLYKDEIDIDESGINLPSSSSSSNFR